MKEPAPDTPYPAGYNGQGKQGDCDVIEGKQGFDFSQRIIQSRVLELRIGEDQG